MTTLGLNHVHLVVTDLERSVRFYREAFGLEERGREDPGMVFLGTPGHADLLTLKQGEAPRLDHIGFMLTDPANELDAAVAKVEQAGGRVVGREDLFPGWPSAFVEDPDGYVVQL